MGTPKGINQKGKYTSLNARLNSYILMIQQVFGTCNLETAKIAERTGYAAGNVPFRFSDYPETRAAVQKLQRQFVSDMGAVIYRGTSDEWKQSNLVQDLLADKILKYYGSRAGGEKHRVYYQTNSDVLKAFQQRRISGEFNLSELLWNQSENYKTEMEYAISSALEKGTSAVTLSKRLSKYLNDFDRLKDDYKDKYGKAVECQDCEYRSMRLARSEINMAYRTAEWTRWQQMDFVVGFEIKLSKSHHDRMPHGDICDDLAGKYPKDFKWTGWHPNDMCYLVPILKDEDDFWADDDGPSKNEVTDVPDAMKRWINDNEERIGEAKRNGTLPYWLRDNDYKSLAGDLTQDPYRFAGTTLSKGQIERLLKSNGEIMTENIFSKEGVYRDDRVDMHNQIVKDYIGDSRAKSDYVYMLGGAPANGKSTLVDSGLLPHPKGALVIDPDKLKAMIPEYGIMTESGNKMLVSKAANFVHEESSMLGKRIQEEAYKRNIGVVIDGVNGGSFEKVSKKIENIRKATGKKIRADYVTLDTELSVKLAEARAKKTGRVVPESFIRSSNKNIAELIPQLVEHDVFDELYLWDTNVNGTPRLILKVISGKIHIESPDLYEKFLAKAK